MCFVSYKCRDVIVDIYNFMGELFTFWSSIFPKGKMNRVKRRICNI